MITLTHFYAFSVGVSVGMASKKISTLQDFVWGYILVVLRFFVTLGGLRNPNLNRLRDVKAELYTRYEGRPRMENNWNRC